MEAAPRETAAPQPAAGPEKTGIEKEIAAYAGEDLRATRTKALVRHAKAVDDPSRSFAPA